MTDNQDKRKVFISYSHKDKQWLDRVRVYLKHLERGHDISFWHDQHIEKGAEWRKNIKQAISESCMALLLVSEEFIASDFIHHNELPPMLKKASEKSGMKILSLIVSPCSYAEPDNNNINQFQAINDPATPLSTLEEPDWQKVLVEVARTIKELLEKKEGTRGPVEAPRDEVLARSDDWRLRLPEKFNGQRSLVFDIDGTLLEADEKLSDVGRKRLLELLAYFIEAGFHIVFISGNDYRVQHKRVLEAILSRHIAHSVTCFSDGGSRLFEYSPAESDYSEVQAYSKDTRISPTDIEKISETFKRLLETYLKDDNHKQLCDPNIKEIDRVYYQDGRVKYIDIRIFPIKPSFYRDRYDKLRNTLDEAINDLGIQSPHLIREKYEARNALIIRLMGPYASEDIHLVQNAITPIFTYRSEFKNSALPELELRGSSDFTSQVSIKPFRIPKLRREFLEKLKPIIGDGDFSVLLGGKSTIDIQRAGVDKRKAIIELIITKELDPKKMIYFGDEFFTYGNDLAVASMEKEIRPSRIIHVGDTKKTPETLKKQKEFFVDGNGPSGTLNYLEFLKCEIEGV